nr:MAG TPA: hypothetical protein [Caudoviricetes sp.]
MRLVSPCQDRSLLRLLLGKSRFSCTIHNTCHKTQIIHSFLCITTKIQICEFYACIIQLFELYYS